MLYQLIFVLYIAGLFMTMLNCVGS